MLRKIFLTVTLVALIGLGLTGCKKSPEDSDTTEAPEVKTSQDFSNEAEKEITKENMDAELDKLEKEIDTELKVEP